MYGHWPSLVRHTAGGREIRRFESCMSDARQYTLACDEMESYRAVNSGLGVRIPPCQPCSSSTTGSVQDPLKVEVLGSNPRGSTI